jgi:hypothetical protein
MARRRCARPTSPSSDIQSPQPSGPRGTIVSRMHSNSARSATAALVCHMKIPMIPQIVVTDPLAGKTALESRKTSLNTVECYSNGVHKTSPLYEGLSQPRGQEETPMKFPPSRKGNRPRSRRTGA